MTEYNLDAKGDTVHFGTWAHGLALAAMSLAFLEEEQIEFLVHRGRTRATQSTESRKPRGGLFGGRQRDERRGDECG
jgi:hypothetical protein